MLLVVLLLDCCVQNSSRFSPARALNCLWSSLSEESILKAFAAVSLLCTLILVYIYIYI